MTRTHWGRSAAPLPFGQFAFGEHGLRYATPMRSPGPLKAPGQEGILYGSNTVQQDLEVLLVFTADCRKMGVGSLGGAAHRTAGERTVFRGKPTWRK